MKSKINNEINRIKRFIFKTNIKYFDKYGYKNFKISQLAKNLKLLSEQFIIFLIQRR